MLITFKDLDKGHGNLIVCTGSFSPESFLMALEEHLSQNTEKYKNYYYYIYDVTGITDFERLEFTHIHEIARQTKQASQINPNVVVISIVKDDLALGYTRMWENLMNATNWKTETFKNRQEAYKWLRHEVLLRFNASDLNFI